MDTYGIDDGWHYFEWGETSFSPTPLWIGATWPLEAPFLLKEA
jgi:hypothetical protein